MGYGDAFMATGEVRELRKIHPDAKFIIGNEKGSFWNEVFDNNPFIIRGASAYQHQKIILIENYEGNRPYRLYGQQYPRDNYNWNINYSAKKGEIFFDKEEKKFSTEIIKQIKNKIGTKQIIFIEPYVKIRRGYENRDWGFQKWQKVVDNLKDRFEFIHLTYGDRIPLKNTINIHGVNYRSSVAILSKSDLFLGTEGGLHHAAAATEIKSIVIFGGHISPKITGYNFHENIYIDMEGSPCGSKLTCDHCLKCMELITPEIIITKIIKLLES